MKKEAPARKRGLAPRALLEDDARRSALASLERPVATPAAAFVRAALEEPAAPPPPPAPAPVIATQERTLRAIPLAEVDLGKRRFQYRVTRSLSRLQESLLTQGQQVPVIVRGLAPPYEIVSGFGRCDALRALAEQGKIEEARVWADLRFELSDREAHEISVLENEEREGLCELDRINKARRLRDEGYTVSEIASVLKKSERMVQYYLSLAEAPKRIFDALESGAVRPTHALVLTKFARDALAEHTPPEIDAKLEELIGRCGKGVSVPELRAFVNRASVAAPRLFVPRGAGFELKGFHYAPTLERADKEALLAALDEARARIQADLAR